MPRNLERRVEILFPVEEPALREKCKKILEKQLKDTRKAHILGSDGVYKKVDKRGKELFDSQQYFCDEAMEMTKQKEEADKRLLFVEVVIGVVCIAIMLSLTAVASLVQMEEWLRILLIVIGMVPILIAGPFMLRIEQVAGYYECKKCKHRYVPTYKAVNLAPHMGRTRYMRCPHCNEKSWQKKVLSKEK
jgi:hypothetical protein